MTQREIADEVGIERSTVAKNVKDSRTGKIHNEPETAVDPEIEAAEAETEEALEADLEQIPESEPVADEATTDEELATPESEPDRCPPETIPHPILKTARTVMVGFVESRPDAYVARLEVSPSEWMAITDDSLFNELERQLLTSAAAMC